MQSAKEMFGEIGFIQEVSEDGESVAYRNGTGVNVLFDAAAETVRFSGDVPGEALPAVVQQVLELGWDCVDSYACLPRMYANYEEVLDDM